MGSSENNMQSPNNPYPSGDYSFRASSYKPRTEGTRRPSPDLNRAVFSRQIWTQMRAEKRGQPLTLTADFTRTVSTGMSGDHMEGDERPGTYINKASTFRGRRYGNNDNTPPSMRQQESDPVAWLMQDEFDAEPKVLPPQSKFYKAQVFFQYLFLVLQLALVQLSTLCMNYIRRSPFLMQTHYYIWRLKIFLRTKMRDLLWRMLNSKTSDMMLFFFVLVASPWLFAISLAGFVTTIGIWLKKILSNVIQQIRYKAI